MGRAPCCDKNGLKKGPWTPEEDKKLLDYIQEHGHGSWRTLPKNAGLQRCGKSCRLRWTNYLRPDIKRGRFSFEEEETIIQLHSVLGNKWSAIAGRLPGRTDNEIKNFWNTHIRKRLLRMGIDPVTHNPRLDLLDLSSILNSSLYNQSLLNVSQSLGIQPVVHPEILRLATSLLSSQRDNHNQQVVPQENQIQMQNGTCTTSSTPCAPFLDETQLVESNILQEYQSSPTNFSYQDSVPNQWQHNAEPIENYVLQLGHGYFDHDFTFPSIVSTPTSSPITTLSSSPTVTQMNSISSTEDERESYCSDMLKFEIPHVLDVNDFL